MSEHGEQDVRLEGVYRAPSESVANIVKALLEGEGIPVVLKSMQIPWYDGVMRMGEGYWGDVLVREEQADRAREIIRACEPDGQGSYGSDED